MKIHEIHEYVWDIFASKQKPIFDILTIQTPHISVPRREINCLNRENENQGFRENMDSDVQITCQNHIFNENLK